MERLESLLVVLNLYHAPYRTQGVLLCTERGLCNRKHSFVCKMELVTIRIFSKTYPMDFETTLQLD